MTDNAPRPCKLPDGKPRRLSRCWPARIGPDVVDIRTLYGKTGMFTYDPGFLSTASCSSSITYIDGDAGDAALPRLPDRAARASTATSSRSCYLLLYGELPNRKQKDEFVDIVTHHTMVHEQLARSYHAASGATRTRWR